MATKITYKMASGNTFVQTIPEDWDAENVRCMLVKHVHIVLHQPNGGGDFVLRTDRIESVGIIHV